MVKLETKSIENYCKNLERRIELMQEYNDEMDRECAKVYHENEELKRRILRLEERLIEVEGV